MASDHSSTHFLHVKWHTLRKDGIYSMAKGYGHHCRIAVFFIQRESIGKPDGIHGKSMKESIGKDFKWALQAMAHHGGMPGAMSIPEEPKESIRKH